MDWRLLASTFAVLFMAELGDKTQLAVITLTCQQRKPMEIFIGASLALATVTLLGVLGGEALVRVVPEMVLRRAAAAAFVLLGVLMWFRVL